MVDNCLFVGNGLNRCLAGSISWSALLDDIAEELGVDYNEYISMPLEFERIVNAHLKKHPQNGSTVYNQTKKMVAQKLSGVALPADALHLQIGKLPIDAIITTNYDFLLEQIYDPAYSGDTIGNEVKYLPDSTYKHNKISFYHPHGIASKPGTLCLGYEHYMGIVEHIRRDINTTERKTKEMIIKQVLFDKKQRTDTWFERFYTSNIAMIGFGLAECEADIWWLLTHRAFLYYADYEGCRKRLQNQIMYYDIIEDTKAVPQGKQNLYSLLENQHVKVTPVPLSKYGTYEGAYRAILNHLANDFTAPAFV